MRRPRRAPKKRPAARSAWYFKARGTLYCRMTPCRTCAMLIINCGIVRVVCERRYHDGAESEEMFRQVGIELVYKYDEIQQYDNQK